MRPVRNGVQSAAVALGELSTGEVDVCSAGRLGASALSGTNGPAHAFDVTHRWILCRYQAQLRLPVPATTH